MPRPKQPIPLQKLAFDALVIHSVYCCGNCGADDSVTRLRQIVADIKQHVHNYLPVIVFEEFCITFVDKFHRFDFGRQIERPDEHDKAALDIIMDIKIVEITFQGRFVYFGAVKAPLVRPSMIVYPEELPSDPIMFKDLVRFHLSDLTTLILPSICTDDDLEIVGFHCSKLQVLRIPDSQDVTDSGLRALTPCSDHLRVISIQNCRVSDCGVNELLNIHTKLEEFNVADCGFAYFQDNFSILSRSILLVCPSMKRFSLRCCSSVTNAHLISTVSLFPNLTYLDSISQLTCDLCILKDLKNLTELKFDNCIEFNLDNLKELLMIIGENITVLTMQKCHPKVGLTQNDLNLIFKICGNIEELAFDYQPFRSEETLVIPVFKKLKTLRCTALIDYSLEDSCVRLEFGEMLTLEDLTIENFDETFYTVESMMLDNVRFPQLREVGTFDVSNENANRIIEFAKNSNLDFSLTLLVDSIFGNIL